MTETTIFVEMVKQAPSIAALLWLVYTFLKAMKDEREACAKERAEARRAAEQSRTESRADFLAELERTHQMYQASGKA